MNTEKMYWMRKIKESEIDSSSENIWAKNVEKATERKPELSEKHWGTKV